MANLIKRCDCTCAEQTTPCSCAGSSCYLTLPTDLINETTTPYSDLTAAGAAIAAEAIDCLAQYLVTEGTLDSSSASVAGGVLSLTTALSVVAGGGTGHTRLVRAYLTAADDLAVAYSLTSDVSVFLGSEVRLYDDTLTLLDTQTDGTLGLALSGTFNFTVPSDGYYYIMIIDGGSSMSPPVTMANGFDYDLDGGASAEFCTVRAAYGGTPDYLVCS
jgi:hypothetical protein